MKTDAINHPKTRRLKRILNLKLFEAVGILEGLFQFACQFADDGRVGKWAPAELADFLEWPGDPHELLAALSAAGWLDGEGEGATVHDWVDHCPQYIKQRHTRRAEKGDHGNQQQPAATAGHRRQPAAATGHLPTYTPPGETHQHPTPPEIKALWDRLKSLKGLKPPKWSSVREEQLIDACLAVGRPALDQALDRFPLAESKLMFSCCAPDPFEPGFEFLVNNVLKIAEGNFSVKQPPSRRQLAAADLARQIKGAARAVDQATTEKDREHFGRQLADLEKQKAAIV